MLLTEYGAVRLRLDGEGGTLVPVLREMKGLSLGEARLAAADLSEEGLISTFVEMTLLAQGLERWSVATTLVSSPV
ncbi:hypothetical protein ACIOEZ_16695 [Streptomyces sp. NPDC087866]|uniref:hypothetical protein n=1 Tax=unclassified Streptomyces TaxID=2593676 RepID=UPI0033BC12EC